MTARGPHPPHGCIVALTPAERRTVRVALVRWAWALKDGLGVDTPGVPEELQRIDALLARLD